MWLINRIAVSRTFTFKQITGWGLSKSVPIRAYADAGTPTERPKSSVVISGELMKAWKAAAPSLEFPKVPSNFLQDRPAIPATIPTKITINFVLPRKYEIQSKEVDMVILPATSGMIGVLPGHVPTIAELKPGVLSIHDGTEIKKYIVSSGFAFVHANSVTDVLAVEAVLAENLDIEEAKRGLADYTTKLSSATTDRAKAEAQIGVDVYGSLVAALS